MAQAKVIRIHPDDDLIVALRDLPRGERVEVDGISVVLTEPIRRKHPIATRDFKQGDPVRMHGVLIGELMADVPAGGALTTGNLRHASSGFESRDATYQWQGPDVQRWAGMTFDGFAREEGRYGTANHWIVIPMVFCENRNLLTMREAMSRSLGYARAGDYEDLAQRLAEGHRAGSSVAAMESLALNAVPDPARRRLFPNVDGLKFLTHSLGCGGMREDSTNLCRLFARYIEHPNVAGATVLSLGCQNAEVRILLEELERSGCRKPVHVYEQQKTASERVLIEQAIKKTFIGMAEADRLVRESAPLSALCIGMECGGSDGFSGISSNPVLGAVSDRIVALGGTAILSEFPELCGVEQQLVDRCADRATADRFVTLMRAYAGRAEAVGGRFDMNPSPGNIADGLLTDAIKSAGAAKKGGSSPIVDAVDYPESVHRRGLNLLCTPGNDVESTTAMAGAGANLILFSTGLGTPTGNPVVPVIKVSSNTDTAQRLSDLIDFDAGPVVEGMATIDALGDQLLDLSIEVASGRAVPKAVQLGQDDFIPWKRGVSL